MYFEDEMFIDDDLDILEIIDYGFPRRHYLREEYFDILDNLTFFKRFRLTKPTVLNLLEPLEEHLEYDNNLNDSVSPMNQLLATLRFYACGTHQDAIGDYMGMHQSTASRIIKRVSMTLAGQRPIQIIMPDGNEIIRVQHEFYQIAHFPSIVGCIDGTHIKIKSPGGAYAEIYRNRKNYFSMNTQIICDANLHIRNIVARWPGSAHDMTIFNHSNIKARMERGDFPNSVLLGDSGYGVRPYLLTPLANPRNHAENRYNESQIRTRNTVERTIGVWKTRFLALLYGLRCKMETIKAIIVATAVLHNIARKMNEPEPPLPDELNQQELDYLLELGNIPVVAEVENIRNYPIHRQNLINNFFANL